MQTLIHISKRLFPKPSITFMEQIPSDEPVVFVANHEKNYGPSVMQLFFPIRYRPWIIYNMLNVDVCQLYVQETFFEERLGWSIGLSKIMSKLLALTLVNLMNYTNPIPVYRERPDRIIETFRQSISALEEGDNLLIFPENPNAADYSDEVKTFFDGFLYLAKLYQRKREKGLLFCPVSINPKAHTISVGKVIRYNPDNKFNDESERINKHLMQQVAGLYHQPWLQRGVISLDRENNNSQGLQSKPV